MTYMFTHPVYAERRLAGGQSAYINIWKLDNVDGLHPGQQHWTREAADKALSDRSKIPPTSVCLYRVVVRWKQ